MLSPAAARWTGRLRVTRTVSPPPARRPRLMLPACEKFSMYAASEGAKTLAGRAAPPEPGEDRGNFRHATLRRALVGSARGSTDSAAP